MCARNAIREEREKREVEEEREIDKYECWLYDLLTGNLLQGFGNAYTDNIVHFASIFEIPKKNRTGHSEQRCNWYVHAEGQERVGECWRWTI